MTAAKDSLLVDQTVDYNGVQFGGADSTYKMMPPTYSLEGHYVYDEAGRAITHTSYTLQVNTIVFHTDEAQQSAQMEGIRQRLAKPGRTLKLKGLGLGFDENPQDLIWGVKPRAPRFAPVGGEIAHELSWAVEFNISECQPSNVKGVWMAMNWQQSWSYDFEGLCTRTIQGYYEIPQVRPPTAPDRITAVADELRGKLRVAVPFGFRRVRWDAQEDKAKRRIDFVFVDQECTAEPFPAGITQADGEFSVDAEGVGLVNGSANLSMSLTTAPGIDKWQSAKIAIAIALARQTALQSAVKEGSSAIIPNRMRWGHRLWSRTSRFDFGWSIAGCAGDILLNGGVWQPIPGSNWTDWFASVRGLYANRGVSGLHSNKSEDAIIDICSDKSADNIGGSYTQHDSGTASQPAPFKWACNEPSKENSWLLYDVDVRVARHEEKWIHRTASLITAITGVASGVRSLIGPSYRQPTDEAHQVEQQGYPTQRVILRWKGLRIHHEPEYPVLKSIGGQKVTLLESEAVDPQPWGCFGGCKVWFAQTAQVYEVLDGHVQKVAEDDYQKDQTLCCS